MLVTDKLPELCADLVAALAALELHNRAGADGQAPGQLRCPERPKSASQRSLTWTISLILSGLLWGREVGR